MKKVISLVLVVVMICSTFAGLQIGAYAATYTGSCGPNARYSLNISTGVLSITGSGAMTSTDYFDIGRSPGTTNQNYIKTVTVASGITEICYGAFQYCGNLTSVSLPNTLKYIGSSAFEGCEKLTSLKIPNSVTEIGSVAFCGSGIKELEIPVNVSKLGQEAFAGMTNLKSFIWNADNPEIKINLNGSSLFDGTGKNVSGGTTLTFGSSCKKLDYGIYILESIMENEYDSDRKNYIGTINVNHHIDGALSIGSAYLTQTVNVYSHIDDFESYIEEYSEYGYSPVFCYGNKKTKGIIVNVLNGSNALPSISNYSDYDSSVIDKGSFTLNYNDYDNLEIVPSALFYKLSSSGIEKTFGSNKMEKVKYIMNGAFSYSSIDFVPKNVEYIGSEAFKNCSQLKTIYFSKNLKTINYCAFDNCTNLKEIYYEGTRADWEQIAIARQSSSAYSEYDYFSKAVVHCSDDEHEKPTGSISSTNNVAASQTATLALSDNKDVAGYYWGTNSNYASNTYTTASAGNITKTISSAGTYYLTVKDISGNISDTVSITYYKTTLNANSGSVSPTSVLTQKGKSFTFPTPTRSGYTYQGWSTSSSATSGVKSLTAGGNKTYYAVWAKNDTPNNVGNMTVSLSQSTLYFDGTPKEPRVTVKDGSRTLVENTDYAVVYSNNVDIGTATVTIVGTGTYTGKKEVKFEIVCKHNMQAKVIKPTSTNVGHTEYVCSICGEYQKDSNAKVVKNKFTAPTGKLTLKHAGRNVSAIKVQWNNVKTATGYQVQISTKDGKKWDKYYNLKAETTQYTFKSLAAGNAYKFRVRFYIKAADGKNYYSPWSKTLTSPTSPKGVALTKLTPGKKCFTAKWKQNKAATGYQLQYSTYSDFKKASSLTFKNPRAELTCKQSVLSKKAYYVRIRTYIMVSGEKYYSTWSKTYKVKTK